MKPSKLLSGLRRSAMFNVSLVLLVLAAAGLSPVMAQCPPGQKLMPAPVPTGVVRIVPVPASASNFPSGVVVRPGFHFVMTAVGSIRVGVFGETGTSPDGGCRRDRQARVFLILIPTLFHSFIASDRPVVGSGWERGSL